MRTITKSFIDVTAAIAEAKDAIDAKYAALERVAVMRETLRNALKTKVQMTKEQQEYIEGTFPVHERKSKDDMTPAEVAELATRRANAAAKRAAEAQKAAEAQAPAAA